MVLVKMFDFYFMIVMLIGLGFTTGLLNGHKFYVGGRDGWVLTPSEDYSHWSHRNRFQVNDTLYFKYVKGKDSVLEVSEDEYNTCNTTHPMTSLSDGDSLFLLSRSGTFFFVSNSGNCLKGLEACRNGHVHRPPQPHSSSSLSFPITFSVSGPSGFVVAGTFSRCGSCRFKSSDPSSGACGGSSQFGCFGWSRGGFYRLGPCDYDKFHGLGFMDCLWSFNL